MCIWKSVMSKNDMMNLRIPYTEHHLWILTLYATFLFKENILFLCIVCQCIINSSKLYIKFSSNKLKESYILHVLLVSQISDSAPFIIILLPMVFNVS